MEAIKARRSHNEQAVEAILEANKQRLNFRRRQQSEKQQMLYTMTNGTIIILHFSYKIRRLLEFYSSY